MIDTKIKTNQFYLTATGEIVFITKFLDFTDENPNPIFLDSDGRKYDEDGVDSWKELSDTEAVALGIEQSKKTLKELQRRQKINNIITKAACAIAIISVSFAVLIAAGKA